MGSGQSFPVVQLPRERIVLVTGANSGLGYEIAKWTAMLGATVVMACRSEERANTAIRRMNAEFLAEKSRGTQGLTDRDELSLHFIQLDLASFASVGEFVLNFKRNYDQLHVMFLNAGLGLGPYVKTADGFELLLQVNYLSQFIITARLLPLMKKSGPDCRILLMSSVAHKSGTFDIDTINYTGPPSSFPTIDYYGRSKLYQIMQMYSMVKRLKDPNITINSIHPGVVDTEFGRDATKCIFKFFICCAKTCHLAKKADDAAKCSIDCVVNPKLQGVTGIYFVNFDRVTPSRQARNENYQEALWKKTFEFVGKYISDEETNMMEGKT